MRELSPRKTNVAGSLLSETPISKSSGVSSYPGLTADTRKVKWEHCQDGEIGAQ